VFYYIWLNVLIKKRGLSSGIVKSWFGFLNRLTLCAEFPLKWLN